MSGKHVFRCLVLLFLDCALICLVPVRAAEAPLASAKIPGERMNQYADLAQKWEIEYLKIYTTNPPGNEARTAAFFKRILDQEGIENKVFDYAPGRADLWA